MDEFSLWDQVRACLGCWRKPDVNDDDDLENGGSAGPELDRLLFESENDTDADVLSLHSNLGISRSPNVRRDRHSQRRGGGKAVTLFGYHLFGRPRAPYMSPNNSEDESSALEPTCPPQPVMPQSDPATLDPDATSISDAAIVTLALPHANAALAKWDAPLTDEQIALEEGRQREKEERMARRAARRLRKQQRAEAEAEVAADLAGGFEITPHDDAPQFEGFPGGNETLSRDAVRPQVDGDEAEYGPWVGNSQQQHYGEPHPSSTGDDDLDDDEVDFGGEYNRRSRPSGRSGSGSGSNSRHSRTGHSQASSIIDGSLYSSRRIQSAKRGGIASPHNIHLPPSSPGTSHGVENVPQLPKRTSKRLQSGHSHSSAARSHGSSSTSQSASILSPLAQEFFGQTSGIGVEPQFRNGEDVELVRGSRVASSPKITGLPSTTFGKSTGKRTSSLSEQQDSHFV